MKRSGYAIQIISAPSILGLKPSGVELLGESLLGAGLAEYLRSERPIIHVPTLNHLYTDKRDAETNCLNTTTVREFSSTLGKTVSAIIEKNLFPFVLGGDCSILIGVMQALKLKADFGLLFIDAHADFYEPERSPTGEVADMDLAIITGRGPTLLTNIDDLQPYIADKNVIHIGQRDWEETRKYNAQDIRETAVKCIPFVAIERKGINSITAEVLQLMDQTGVSNFWIHFDTDVLSDEINPAVDYRLPGGLHFDDVEILVKKLLLTGRIAGMTITIFNPRLDSTGHISKSIAQSLGRAFDLKTDR